jgi:hypothetical protein
MLPLPLFAADPLATPVVATAPAPAPVDMNVSNVDMRVWEPQNQHHPLELHGGPLYWRRVGSSSAQTQQGWEGGFGSGTLVRVRPFVLMATTSLLLRGFDSASYAVSFVQDLSAGLSIGPLEPDIRAGLSMLTVDAFHGNWSAELFSPRIAAGGWLRFGRLGLGAHVFGEYLWRWLGDGNVLDRGLVFSLSLER